MVSTAYYALFHCLAKNCADTLVGRTRAHRSGPAWRQAYRALEHGHAKNQCSNQSAIRQFPVEIQDFGGHFIDLQRQRHYADYAPNTDYHRLAVVSLIDETERVIAQFNTAPTGERRAFAIHVLFRTRRD